MTRNISSISLSSSSPISLRAHDALAEGSLQGRVVTKGAPLKETAWDKICRVFREVVEWIKNLFDTDPKPMRDESTRKLTPSDTSFLKAKDDAFNLKRLSEMSVLNAPQSVCTLETFKSVPTVNAIRLGYEDPVEYQTALGDQVIALETGAIALTILGVSGWTMFASGAASSYSKFQSCIESAADIWQNTKGKTFLATSALLLGASLYAHRKGWLGALIHDRSLGLRGQQTEVLFRNAAYELMNQALSKPDEAVKTASKILENIELIEATLHVDLQLPLRKAKAISENLKNACEEVLSMGLTPPPIAAPTQPPVQPPIQEKQP